jgi:dTDP-4-dehydrorhamnose reductase
MRILLTGSSGQIGRELAPFLSAHDVIAPSHAGCDLADPASIRNAVRDARPDVIINPAAYTAVDKAEQETSLAHAVNAVAPGVFADEAKRLGIPLIHFSTDYVFDGNGTAPYDESHPVSPVNAYGRTKLDGENAVVASGCTHVILRTAWVYARHGKNFLLTIERLARERPRLTIVADQRGTPNWARELARAAANVALRARDELSEKRGIYHLTSRGETTWHGFATAIVDSMDLPQRPAVVAITTTDFPTPARRPAYSVLSSGKLERTFGIVLPHWEDALAACQSSG